MAEIDPTEPPFRSPLGNWMPIFYVLFGIGFGAVVMMVVSHQMNAAKNSGRFTDLSRGTAVYAPSQRAEPIAQSETKPSPPSLEVPIAAVTGASTGRTGMDVPSSPAVQFDPGAAPSTATQPPSLVGTLPSGNLPLKPIVIDGDQGLPAPTVGYTEISAFALDTDVEVVAQQVKRAVRATGGQVLLEFDRELDRPEVGKELVLSVPKANAERLLDELLKLPSTEASDRWTGSADDRLERMQRPYREAVATLDKRLGQLRIRFHDDATEVVRTAETLDRVQRALRAVKAVAPSLEAIRVTVGNSSTRWP